MLADNKVLNFVDSLFMDEFDAWLEKRDWSDEFDGVSVCDWD